MALYVPPQLAQQQVQLRVQPQGYTNFNSNNSQSSNFSHGTSSNHDHPAIPELTKSTEPNEECLTVDLSNQSYIHFSKWNGVSSKILEANTISPPNIGITDGNINDINFTSIDITKLNLKISSGKDTQRTSDKFTPHDILKQISQLDETYIKESKHEKLIKYIALFIHYSMNVIGYPPSANNSEKETSKPSTTATTTTKKTKSKSNKIIKTLTLILPTNIYSVLTCQYILQAAKLVKVTIRNIFTESISNIAYLYDIQSTNVEPDINNNKTLFMEMNKDFYLLALSTYPTSTNTNDKKASNVVESISLTLIHCEVNSTLGILNRISSVGIQHISNNNNQTITSNDSNLIETELSKEKLQLLIKDISVRIL